MAFRKKCWLSVAVILLCISGVCGTIVAKSSMDRCSAYGGSELQNHIGAPCSKKLVVAMSVYENEGASQKIEAKIAKVTDTSGEDIRNVHLQNPVRIFVNKSPVLINYRLYQIGVVHNHAFETLRPRIGGVCRDDWYVPAYKATCGFKYDLTKPKNKHGKPKYEDRIFDSQGRCCHCKVHPKHNFFRGTKHGCANRRNQKIGHCLDFDKYEWYVFGLYPPQLKFIITVVIQQLTYKKADSGEEVWEEVSRIVVGPHRRISTSKNYQVKVEYIADFNPSSFVKTAALDNRFLLAPTSSKNKGMVDRSTWKETRRFLETLRNSSEWLAVPKPMVDVEGRTCNTIGVSYTAFRNQPQMCSREFESCLKNQPFLLWREDMQLMRKGRPGKYMLHNFGKLHSVPHSRGLTDYQVNFIARNPSKSLITISMAADDITIVDHRSPGRIVEAYVETFESLSETGTLLVLVQNIGRFTVTYKVYVLHCSAGIDSVNAMSVTLDPNEVSNVSFVIHSYHAIGKVNHCTLELSSSSGEMFDNMTVSFETLDTCFCYGHCGCACGDENTTCPENSDAKKESIHIEDPFKLPQWLIDLGNFFKLAGPGIAFMIFVYYILACLGLLKVLHIIISGDMKIPEPVTIALSVVLKMIQTVFQEWFPKAAAACSACCSKCISFCVGCTACLLTAGKSRKEEQLIRKVGIGWRIPRNCNGMCKGAKFARRKHRKLMRVNKRKGMKNETAWFQKPYRCTCKVKDNMPCCQILKGLFFFHYCILLPLIWTLHYLVMFAWRKWKRHRRKKRFRTTRNTGNKDEDQAYLQLDKYSRGKIEREILDLNEDIKKARREKIREENEGYNPEDATDMLEPTSTDSDHSSDEDKDKVYASSDQRSSDTSDPDEAGDMEELLSPGHPVFFNYPLAKNLPPSLRNPAKMLSVRGRLRTSEKTAGSYVFDLYKYTYQVKEVTNGKVHLLEPPQLLTNLKEFGHTLSKEQALKLVTLSPLFPCLNDTTSFVIRLHSKTHRDSAQHRKKH